ARNTTRNIEDAGRTDVASSITNGTERCACSTPASTASFEKKPGSGHTPASASVATRNDPPTHGRCPKSPPIRNTSLVWKWWITMPAPRNSSALNTPCVRSEEHTSELQSRVDLVCRLLLEKKNKH